MSERPADKPDHNVYTILVMVATVLVVAASVFLAIENQQLFGTWNPFTPV